MKTYDFIFYRWINRLTILLNYSNNNFTLPHTFTLEEGIEEWCYAYNYNYEGIANRVDSFDTVRGEFLVSRSA